MQNCRPPSFSLTNTTALHHAHWLGWIAPDSNISWRWFWTSSTKGGGICQNHSLKGVSSITFIICSVEWVQPNSVGSNENTSWYSAKSWQAVAAISGGQDSNPLKSNSSNSFASHSLTVNFGAIRILGLISSPATGFPLAAWAMGCCNCPGHWGFLPEGLWVSHTVPYHHDCLLTAFPQLCVCILYGEALQQRAVSSL